MQQQHKIRQQLVGQDCQQKKNRRQWPQQALSLPQPHRNHMLLKGNFPSREIPQYHPQQGLQTQFHN
jgi:hypothetical protein